MIITIIYHVITGFFSLVLILNFIRTEDLQDSLLYLVILMPFLLRTLHIR